MNRIATYIREGSMAFLVREYKVLTIYSFFVALALWYALGGIAAISFIAGAFLSLLAGFFGMKAATYANVRTSQAAANGSKSAAWRSDGSFCGGPWPDWPWHHLLELSRS
jgi:K(+)-stimulated pyrophosphate-energized sodium pump